MPPSRSLERKRWGQTIVDCAAEEPTPVPRPGGHLFAERRHFHLPRHTRQKFVSHEDTFCCTAKSRGSRMASAAALPSTKKNSSSRESPGGTATFERTSAQATAAPRASHPNQKTPLPLRSSPLPHLLPFSPQPPFALSHRLLLRALLSPHRPDISRDVFPPFH